MQEDTFQFEVQFEACQPEKRLICMRFDRRKEWNDMATTNINVRVDSKLKADAETLFSDLGMNMSTAIIIFLKTAVRQNGIPLRSVGLRQMLKHALPWPSTPR